MKLIQVIKLRNLTFYEGLLIASHYYETPVHLLAKIVIRHFCLQNFN